LIAVGLLSLFGTWQLIKVDRFYAERPILHAMGSVHDGRWSNDSEPAQTILLQRVPLGTGSESVAVVLSKEGFECNTIRRPSDENSRNLQALETVEMNGAQLNCQLLAPAGMGYTRWIIDLWFDEAKRLLGVKVAIWNILL